VSAASIILASKIFIIHIKIIHRKGEDIWYTLGTIEGGVWAWVLVPGRHFVAALAVACAAEGMGGWGLRAILIAVN
jgi:hypothetical protein